MNFSKSKILIASIIVSIILFISIITIEKTAVKYTPTTKVVYCIKDINKKEPLDASKFILKEVSITSVDGNTIRSLDQIKNMYARENIYSNEMLNKKRIGTKEEVETYTLNPGEREISINFESLADCVGGKLRKDDKVDIVFTNSASSMVPTTITQTKLKNLRILEARDGSGRIINKTDKETPAVILNIAAPITEAHLIANLTQYGKVKLIKVPDEDQANYNNIKIENGNVINK